MSAMLQTTEPRTALGGGGNGVLPPEFSRLRGCGWESLGRGLKLDQVNSIYRRLREGRGHGDFLQRALDELGVTFKVSSQDLTRIPRTGPLVIVANHPFGAIDGLILAALIRTVRPDVKVMANHLLRGIEDLKELMIFVDPFAGADASAKNVAPLRQAVDWLKSGGALAFFPAGEVAHFELATRRITEPSWKTTALRLARKAQAPVVPVFFDGRNGVLFHLMGLIHPTLRTAMLPRELIRKRGTRVQVYVGDAIPRRRLDEDRDEQQMTNHLRLRTLMLRYRRQVVPQEAQPAIQAPVIATVGNELLAAEIAALPPENCLSDGENFQVFEAHAAQIPNLLREIGRLREITFRGGGEGTGRDCDLDRFDNWYTHLFLWDKTRKQLAGGYRLGHVDEIVKAHGIDGLYTSTLFAYRPQLFRRLGPSMEIGRAFVTDEYQKCYSPLLMLWKGIARHVAARPRYRMLLGSVSISSRYSTVSRQLMVQFLEAHLAQEELSSLTRPRNAFDTTDIDDCDPASILSLLSRGADTDDLVAHIEADAQGIPVLLRQYIKLGATFVSANVDADFNNAIDALMVVDITRIPMPLLVRFLGVPKALELLAYHGVSAPQADSARGGKAA